MKRHITVFDGDGNICHRELSLNEDCGFSKKIDTDIYTTEIEQLLDFIIIKFFFKEKDMRPLVFNLEEGHLIFDYFHIGAEKYEGKNGLFFVVGHKNEILFSGISEVKINDNDPEENNATISSFRNFLVFFDLFQLEVFDKYIEGETYREKINKYINKCEKSWGNKT